MDEKNPVMSQSAHEDYERLLVLASSGALAADEWRQLSQHLNRCERCRAELGRYQEVAGFGLSLIAPNDVSLDVENEWSPESAVAKLMRTLSEQDAPSEAPSIDAPALRPIEHRSPLGWFGSTHAIAFAAAAIVVIALAISWHYLGRRTEQASARPALNGSGDLGPLLKEKSDLQQQTQQQSKQIEALSNQLREQASVVDELRAAKQTDDAALAQLTGNSKSMESADAGLRAQLTALQTDRAALEKKLQESEAVSVALQRNFEDARTQHASDLAQINKLELQVSAISREPRPAEIVQAKQVSTSEPDLQGLMGARDLFIADVYDIDKAGAPRKPFGRVFYTRGKSLLFYAFDLDKEPGAKSASTFQVWGRRGYGDTRPLNMGKMYLDSEASGRWVLNYSDAKELARVDAVFVTVEPRGGSEIPKGRQLLYASLQTPANHP